MQSQSRWGEAVPSTYKLKLYERAEAARYSASERFTNGLVALTRTVWHADCTFETAIGAICEVAASAMRVERVSVWEYEPRVKLLRCLQAHSPSRGLATVLGIEVIAEGVEHLDQQEALQAIGVRRMQGWLYARAMEQGEIRGGFGSQSFPKPHQVG